MFYSLVQTIVCVLLIQGGLYALHLNGPSGASTNGGGASKSANGASSMSSVGLQRASVPLSGSATAQLNSASSTNQMLNILSATQHAQHLHAGGSGSGIGGSSGIGGVGGGGSASYAHTFSKSTGEELDNAGRLSQELADMAQLERERLMLLGLAKQTAAANAGTGHHGRPIITGRIQMSPVEEVDGDYASLLLQQPRGPLYGSVVKEPAPIEEDEYADEAGGEYESARMHGDARTRPEKYEYGRIVQPADREEYEQAQRIEELDELIEAEPEIDDMLTDLDSYQYLDELLPPEQRNLWGEDALAYAVVGGNTRPHHLNDGLPLLLNPYRTLEEFEENQPQPHTLQEIFQKGAHSGGVKEHEQAAERQQQAREQQVHLQYQHQLQQKQRLQREQQHHQTKQQTQQNAFKNADTKQRNSGYGNAGYPSHMQLKWQRKRSQQQQQQRQLHQWQRNIFAQQQKQLHHFNTQPQRHSKLSLVSSEATATKHLQPNNNNNNKELSSALLAAATQQRSSSSTSHLPDSGAPIKSEQQQNQEKTQRMQKQPLNEKENADDKISSKSNAAKAGAKLKAQQQQQQQHNKQQQQMPSLKQEAFLHPNHKRSGSMGSGGSMSAAAVAAANNGYSLYGESIDAAYSARAAAV